MKRIISLLLVSIILVLSLASCGEKTDVPKGMQLASSEDVDYYLYVPESWKVDKSSLYSSAYFSSGDATSISATAFALNENNVDVDKWFESFKSQFDGVYKDVSEIKKEEASLAEINGMKYSFSAKLNDREYDFIIIAAVRGLFVYYITYTSVPQYYKDHLEDLDTVLANFKFK